MLVYTSGHSVQGFTLEPTGGSFVYSHRNITLPAKGNIYSINEAYETLYDERTRAYLAHLRSLANHTARYVGSLVADAHRTLLKGGIFLYPPNRKQPEGKLRLMLEVNPYALLIEQAGGKAMSGNGKSPLTITPKTVHDRTSLVMGSKENVNLFADFLSAMESRKAVPLHSESKLLQTADSRMVPRAVPFPDNLFVIGTVNVDETTYMFSPKVLDRANVIEFRVTEEQAAAFLTKTTGGLTTVEAAPKGYAEAFLRLCRDARETPSSDLALATHSRNVQAQIEECHRALRNLFVILRIHRQEFAYRTISEVLRYVYLDFALSEHQDSWRWNVPIDAQILQKVLPKLHGSKRRIGSLLTALAKYCERGDVEEATSFARDETNADTFNANEGNRFPTPQFPGSYEKLCEMVIAVRRDQFVSFIQ